ncbi:uncharacterized protein IAS62_001835 [Cryptococcus decagattii]|uniref:Uncharacterized protein n=1 Tax=Cryptococcus decagattii TaxID=1859122 RepID=A0ABZ2ATK9_9TREE
MFRILYHVNAFFPSTALFSFASWRGHWTRDNYETGQESVRANIRVVPLILTGTNCIVSEPIDNFIILFFEKLNSNENYYTSLSLMATPQSPSLGINRWHFRDVGEVLPASLVQWFHSAFQKGRAHDIVPGFLDFLLDPPITEGLAKHSPLPAMGHRHVNEMIVDILLEL